MPDVPELALLWALKRFHPSVEVRRAVSETIAAWVASLPSAGLRPVMRNALRAERGTVLEPFVVDAEDIDEAADLGAIALHAGCALRVVSRDKLEPLGGLVLRPDDARAGLEVTYAQRLATGASETEVGREIRFAPGSSPTVTTSGEKEPALTALLTVGDQGHVIRIGPLAWMPSSRRDWSSTIRVIGEPDLPPAFWKAGSTADDGRAWLDIRPNGPERAIQATALMLKRRWVVIPDGSGSGLGNGIAMRLSLPSGTEPVPLDTLPRLWPDAERVVMRWLLEPAITTPLADDDELKRELGRWLGLPVPWMTPEVLEGYA